MSCSRTTLFTILMVASHTVAASSRVSGEIANFSSVNRAQEQCIILDPMPGGTYSKEDKATEHRFCAIDFNAENTAVCPKLFSTSPGTLTYDKKTGMLEKIRHYHPDTYTKLSQLNQDFQAKGKLYDYVVNTFGLSDKQVLQITRNTNQATKILQASCTAGKLRFDLDAELYLRMGKVEQNSVNCTIP